MPSGINASKHAVDHLRLSDLWIAFRPVEIEAADFPVVVFVEMREDLFVFAEVILSERASEDE